MIWTVPITGAFVSSNLLTYCLLWVEIQSLEIGRIMTVVVLIVCSQTMSAVCDLEKRLTGSLSKEQWNQRQSQASINKWLKH